MGPLSVSWRRWIKVSLPLRHLTGQTGKRRSRAFPSSLARMKGVLQLRWAHRSPLLLPPIASRASSEPPPSSPPRRPCSALQQLEEDAHLAARPAGKEYHGGELRGRRRGREVLLAAGECHGRRLSTSARARGLRGGGSPALDPSSWSSSSRTSCPSLPLPLCPRMRPPTRCRQGGAAGRELRTSAACRSLSLSRTPRRRCPPPRSRGGAGASAGIPSSSGPGAVLAIVARSGARISQGEDAGVRRSCEGGRPPVWLCRCFGPATYYGSTRSR
jgi:hypothetical protein